MIHNNIFLFDEQSWCISRYACLTKYIWKFTCICMPETIHRKVLLCQLKNKRHWNSNAKTAIFQFPVLHFVGRELWVLSITGCDTKEEGNTTTVNPSTTGYTTITTSRSTTTLPTTSSSTTRTTTRAPTNVPGPTTFMPVMTTRHMNTTVTITTIKTSTESEITTDVTTANTTMLSTTNATEEKEEKKLCPQVKYVGNMHGNEVGWNGSMV